MSRKKQYIEEEVIDKAMRLFWRNGYENTSMQMLEKEMGINKFSIYSSFGNKHGVFIKSIELYKRKTNKMFTKLKEENNGINDIKTFFYDSVDVCYQEGNHKGCLMTNTYNEFSNTTDSEINELINFFMNSLKEIFIQKLKDESKNDETILKEANFLLLAKHGLAAATRVNNKKEISDYIEMIFKNI
ncbi:TetR/AcrR family transcriptional regulator [Tenacibaculum halocynthiae]|uniref:TetR/AcrR family transcriptional regulator n=1 Tax=Tenacibaculum halocynthiae TaxID=1254437 RepID=UPI0038962F09